MSRKLMEESLWKYQLRRENAVLLDKSKANREHLEELAAEVAQYKKDFEEKIAALEKSVEELEKERAIARQEFEKYGEDLASLKSQMGSAGEPLETQNLSLPQPVNEISEGPSLETVNIVQPNVVETPAQMPGSTTSLSSKVTHHQPVLSSSKTPNHAPKPAHVPAPMLKPQSTASASKAPNPASSTRRTRSHSESRPSIGNENIPKSTLKTTLPRLHQGQNTLPNYLKKVESIFQTLPVPIEEEVEIKFIAAFIDGMKDEDKRQTLVEELQLQHMSRRRKGGKVEVMCAWGDVAVGMREKGLLVAKQDSVSKSKSSLSRELKGLLRD